MSLLAAQRTTADWCSRWAPTAVKYVIGNCSRHVLVFGLVLIPRVSEYKLSVKQHVGLSSGEPAAIIQVLHC